MTLPLLAIWKVGQPWYMGREILHLDWPASPCPVAPMWGMPTVRKSQGRIFVLYQFIASCPKVPQLGYRHIGGKIYKLDWLSLSHSHHNKNFQHLLCCFCVLLCCFSAVLCFILCCVFLCCVVLCCVGSRWSDVQMMVLASSGGEAVSVQISREMFCKVYVKSRISLFALDVARERQNWIVIFKYLAERSHLYL